MNLYIYSDESGVFDQVHSHYFTYGGLIVSDGNTLHELTRRYLAIEQNIRENRHIENDIELKATMLEPKDRQRLYRLTKGVVRFGAIIDMKQLLPEIFLDGKTKQRFLDFAYVQTVQQCIMSLMDEGVFCAEEVENMYFNVDEHTSATNGKYELHASLEQVFQLGTFSSDWNVFHRPLFPKIHTVKLKYCNSSTTPPIRAADIVANKIFHVALGDIKLDHDHLYLRRFPPNGTTILSS